MNSLRKASPKVSIIKALTWRFVATMTTTVIVYFVTGSFELGFTAGLFDLFIKLVLYYGHERAWERVLVQERL